MARPFGSDPRNVEEYDQFVLLDGDGEMHHIRVFPPGMSAAAIRAAIDKLGIKGTFTVRFSVAEEHSAWLDRVLAELWPDRKPEEMPSFGMGVHRLRGMLSTSVSDHYFRALAKLAFHYYSATNKTGRRGDETCFDALRCFVVEGGNKAPFFDLNRVYFGTPFGESYFGEGVFCPRAWSHLLIADDAAGKAVVRVQLFLGQGCLGPAHVVALGDVMPTAGSGAWAHLLSWDATDEGHGSSKPQFVFCNEVPEMFTGPGLENSDRAQPLYTVH